ncbi:hypothetical protein DAPPUDRAFT_94696 [Daphnia pulex]|uniref:Uncharacterized protein n=1 Tax=Daphnia pulex TaxID=6669 RepID=E9FST0_DAPPU|nr:hypothetical protein DAPPUDRAFT_94696 [Daphnia pulex]|eukprot:EFX89251.1 hypothetical protein DAPPUDRAFT_94696 [Daphnia pulex]
MAFLICQIGCTNRIPKVAKDRRNQIGSKLFLRQEKQFFLYSIRSYSVQSGKGQHRRSHKLVIVDIHGPKDGNLYTTLKHLSIGNVHKDWPSGSISSQEWHREVAQPPRENTYHPAALSSSIKTSDILSDGRSDEILEEEFYDSSELFDEEEVELESTTFQHTTVAKPKSKDDISVPDREDEDETMEIQSAFTSGISNLPHRIEESGTGDKDKEQVNVKAPAATNQNTPTWKQLYPQLLAPVTPPCKRVIVAKEHPSFKPKVIDNHRVSNVLKADSVYARIQPSLRHRNGTG